MNTVDQTKTVVVPYIFSHQDTNAFYKVLEIIRADKNKKIVKEVINVTPVMINKPSTGMIRGMQEVQMAIIPSAYIEFECTEEHAKEFHYKQTQLIQK